MRSDEKTSEKFLVYGIVLVQHRLDDVFGAPVAAIGVSVDPSGESGLCFEGHRVHVDDRSVAQFDPIAVGCTYLGLGQRVVVIFGPERVLAAFDGPLVERFERIESFQIISGVDACIMPESENTEILLRCENVDNDSRQKIRM